jgi:hypothetical protein
MVRYCWQHRSPLALGVVLLAIVTIDSLFDHLFGQTQAFWRQLLSHQSTQNWATFDIGPAPEVWLSLIGLTLGTLVIVISIASQTIPKIAELYVQDWLSLLYIWFLMVAGSHIILVKFSGELGTLRVSSLVLNIYIFLPLSILLAVPYIFYILKCTQSNTVIDKIFYLHIHSIHNLNRYPARSLLKIDSYREAYQSDLLKSLNQLDNLLEYVIFKEPKAQIIQSFSSLMREFIIAKPLIEPCFFQVGHSICRDISFKTLIDQSGDIELNQTFYEQKCFRLLGNAYVRLLTNSEFDLASLCASEMSKIGLTALHVGDDQLLSVLIIRFNTMLRFALKHGRAHNEARNLYNLAFHYRTFIENLVAYNKVHAALQSFHYLRTYGNEAYSYGSSSSAMFFIVDVFAAEMKKILILVYQQEWPLDIQRQLLSEMLKVDNPPEIDPANPEDQPRLNSGVRTLQIGLALFYLKVGQVDFAQLIVADILDDIEVLGVDLFRQVIDRTCHHLKNSQPTFWEDTDRGNTNLYYTPNPDQISAFLALLEQCMATQSKP